MTSRRIVQIACALVLLSDVVDVRTAAQSCSGCIPQQQTGFFGYKYKFTSNQSDLEPYFQAAKDAWNNAMAAAGNNSRLVYDQLSTADSTIKIYLDSSICPSAWADTSIQNNYIKICPDSLATGFPFMQRLASHELGHVVGLAGHEDCDKQYSVMRAIQPWEIENAATLPGCSDVNAVHTYYSCQPPVGGCQAGYTWSPTYCSCVASPILLTLGSNAFSLTSISGGVEFDLNGDGIRERVSWTAADNDDAFLWMDRNGNGIVDGGQELFGNVTPLSWTLSGPSASNGFEALGWFDLSANGGVPDGSIDSNDAVFSLLRLWRDSNHDGVSQDGEILTLSSAHIQWISLTTFESRRRDQFGNLFKYWAHVQALNHQGAPVSRWAYDVYLGTKP